MKDLTPQIAEIFKVAFPITNNETKICACLGLSGCRDIECPVLQGMLTDKILALFEKEIDDKLNRYIEKNKALEQQLAKAREGLRAVLNYPDIVKYIGTQLYDSAIVTLTEIGG